WVEDDLCSACKVEPVVTVVDSRAASMPDENLLEDTAVPLEEEAGQQAQDLTADEPDFFRRLASLGGVDILIRIFQKNGKLTVSVKPGSIAGALPAITTKDPGDVTAEFFDAIMPIVMTAPPPLAQQEVFPENPAVAPIVRTSVTRVKKKVKKSAPTVKKTTDKKVAKSNIKKVSPPKKRSLKRLPPKKKPVVKEKIKTPKAKPAPKLPKVKAVKPEKPKVKPSLAPPVTEVSLFG
ncbi:MAG TPA: hypothetical protein VK644_14975, partial [Chitinophagaceae bacterium]|nr:hypothetical protein [Chitinophagaceae bacterium]